MCIVIATSVSKADDTETIEKGFINIFFADKLFLKKSFSKKFNFFSLSFNFLKKSQTMFLLLSHLKREMYSSIYKYYSERELYSSPQFYTITVSFSSPPPHIKS